MQACVTGGTGFIGRALVRRMLAEGTRVQVLARPSARADAMEASGAGVVRGELGDQDSVARAVRGAELVVHAAAKVGRRGSRDEFFAANVTGTEKVLEACHQQGVGRVIYISSLAVYGPVKRGEHIDEETPFDPSPKWRDFYSQSKIQADTLAQSYAKQTGLRLVVLRPGVVYGPGRALPVGLLEFRLGRTRVVFGSGSQRVPLNYVENLVDAVQCVSRLEGDTVRQFNIVDDENLTLGQYHKEKREADGTRTLLSSGWPVLLAGGFIQAVGSVLPHAAGSGLSLYQVKRALQDRMYVTRRIREEAGWTPQVPLGAAIRRTLGTAG